VHAYYTLKSIRQNKYNVRSIKWENTLRELSAKLNLNKKVDILFSPFVNSPLSFGFLKPVILFPLRITTGLTNEEIKCILIHELAHNLQNDYLFNIFQHVIETLFFYHPGIWWISKNIRTQREIICDKIVLDNKIPEKLYANTLLKLSELQIADSNLAIAAKQSNKELFTRIKHIINKPDNYRKRKVNPLIVFGVIIVLILSGFVLEGNECKLETTFLGKEIEKSLAPFEGSFIVYDFKNGKYFSSNDSICNMRYPAYSTFKIASSLIALDIGVAKDGSYTIQYDSLKYPLPEWMKENNFYKHWYKDHTLKTALDYSVNWYFLDLGEQIGSKNMAVYMTKLAYGNQKVTESKEQAWYNGQLKISAIEQVELIKNIINQNCNGISKDAQLITKKIFPVKTENNYSIYGKTGTGQLADNRYIGWYVGFIETKTNSYSFALNIFSNDINEIPGRLRQEMVKDIFAKSGLID
jgi:bla regulator protein BlaR1